VNEGPQVLRHPGSGRLFVFYSADASWTQSYKMGLLEWTGGDVGDPGSWRKLPRPFFMGGGHGCVLDTGAGMHLVYHRKLSGDPGWADREIRAAPLSWDADGYPVVHPSDPPFALGSPSVPGFGPPLERTA
jgi:GH43 family beta-xylosidase